MNKKLSLGILALMMLAGCSSVSKKGEFKAETTIKPKSVAVLPANRGTSNDIGSAKLLTESVGKYLTGIEKQDVNKTSRLLDQKLGITVAGQLEGEDKVKLEKELGVDGLVFIDVKEIKTTPTGKLVKMKPAGGIEKIVDIDVSVYNDGKLYKGENIKEVSDITITLDQLNEIKEMITLVKSISSNISGKNVNQILNMPDVNKLVAKLMTYELAERDAIVASLYSTLPTEELLTMFNDVFKKAGVVKGNVYQDLITNAAKKVKI